MKFTNKLNLPPVLERALKSSDYDNKAKYSVTGLMKTPRAFILEKRHHENIETDVSESLWRFMGSAIHYTLQRGVINNDFSEERIYIKLRCGEMIGGQADYYETETKTIYDFKITSLWSIVYKSHYTEWQKQLSIYAWLFRHLGFEVENISNIVICRDWNKRDFEKVDNAIQVIVHEILDSIDGISIEEWVNTRAELFESMENISDNELPLCDSEYRWAESDTWKVYWNESKAENPKSMKNFTGEYAEKEANEYAEYLTERDKDKKKTYRAELIKGDNFKRCEYCSASGFCNQFKEGIL